MVDLGGGPAPTPFSTRTSLLGVRLLEATNVSLFRLSRGRVRGTVLGAPVILVTTSGHRTGVRHTKPLVAFEDGISWIVAGSPGASGEDPEWYENLIAYEESQQPGARRSPNAPVLIAPEVEYAGNRRVAVRAQALDGEEREKWWARMVEVSPRLSADAARGTHRSTPVLRLTPLGY